MMTTAHGGDGTRPPLWEQGWVLWLSSAVLVAVIVAIVLMMMNGGRASSSQPHPVAAAAASTADAVPAGLNEATANLLSVSPVPSSLPPAPGFTLTDQHGQRVSLSRFRGKTVVLQFNDDRCTDLCVMMSTDILQADRDMPAAVRRNVEFVAINANPYYPTPADTQAWSAQHGLGTLANWTYVTGTPKQLAAEAHAYNVPITLHPASRTVDHGTQIFIIDPQGREVALASFGAEAADTAPFGHGLAVLADDALPASQHARIGGADLAAKVPGGTGIGDDPTAIAGPSLRGGGSLSTAADRGRYTVVDFWSSTCTACAVQLPDDQAEIARVGTNVAFLGVDVDDTAAAGQATLARDHASFPTVRDQTGRQAARFRVAQLPYTVILSPSGSVVVRHPGLFTTAELDYELHSLDPGLGGAAL